MLCGRIRSVLRIKWKQFHWWAIPMNVHCKHFCPCCKFYSRCVRDTLYENFLENLHDLTEEYWHLDKEAKKWL